MIFVIKFIEFEKIYTYKGDKETDSFILTKKLYLSIE